MHHMRVALDGHVLSDLASPPTCATRPTSLRPSRAAARCSARSLVVDQFISSARSSSCEAPRFARAGDQTDSDDAFAILWACSEAGRISGEAPTIMKSSVEVVHVERQIERALRAVKRHQARRRVWSCAARADLHDVAVLDVLLGLGHGRLERRFAGKRETAGCDGVATSARICTGARSFASSSFSRARAFW